MTDLTEVLRAIDLFEPAGPHSSRVRCKVCGRVGMDVLVSRYKKCWKTACLRGHAPCKKCGKQLSVLLNGKPRAHPRCPA